MRTAPFHLAGRLAAFMQRVSVLLFASLALAVNAAPTATITFSPAAIATGGTATLLVAISDDAFGIFSGGTLVLTYDPNVVNTASAVAYDTCGSTSTALPGVNQLQMTNITVPTAGYSCQIAVNVTSSIGGAWATTLVPGNFTSASPAGANSNTSSAVLTVVAPVVVTNTNDSGAGSLRDAINTRNATCASGAAINFNIPGAGPFVITPLSELPPITCSGTVVDAYTQPGASKNTNPLGSPNNAVIQIGLDGSLCPNCYGITLAGNSIQLYGFAVYSFPFVGIYSARGAQSNQIYGNYVGTDAGGMAAKGNGGAGIEIDEFFATVGSGSPNDVNLVSNNGSTGILIYGGTVTSVAANVLGNQVGGKRDGSAGNGNVGRGIWINRANHQPNNVSSNWVRSNGLAGIAISADTTTKVVIQNNQSALNGGLGIDIHDDGATLNDEASVPYDTDGVQNYPVITSVLHSGGNTIVDGYLKSAVSRPATALLYANSSASAITEGEQYIGSVALATDASGFAAFPAGTTIAGLWNNISAQITLDTCGDGCVRSSEYSPKVAVFIPPAPTITSIHPAAGSITGGSAVTIDGTNLDSVTSVTIGGSSAVILRQSPGTMVVAAPANAAGVYNVAATNSGGTASVAGGFTYATDDDVARDFTLTINPGARWTYGSETTRGAAFTLYTSYGLQPSNVDFWWNGAEPLLAHNGTSAPIAPAGRNPIPAGGIAMHPGSAGENSVARWTAPAAATYHIAGSFTGLDQAGTTTDVAVLRNNNAAAPLFTANVAEYNLPHPFAIDISLAAGETIEFTVGFGGNGYGSDTTGLIANIAATGPPLQCYVSVGVPATGDAGYFVDNSSNVLVVAPATSATMFTSCFNTTPSAYSWSTGATSQQITITTPPAGTSSSYSVTLTVGTQTQTVSFTLQASAPGAPVCSIAPSIPLPLAPANTSPFSVNAACSGAPTTYNWQTQSGPLFFVSGQNTASATYQMSGAKPGYGYTAMMTPSNASGTGPAANRIIWVSPLDVSPLALAFPTTPVGGQSSTQTITLSNVSDYFTTNLTITPTGPFTITNHCAASLAPMTSCTIDVANAPVSAGTQSGNINVSFPFPGSPLYTVVLSGNATGTPSISLAPSPLTFGSFPVGVTSPTQTVTVTNSGTAALTLGTIAISGDFAMTTNCAASLAPGASCTINVSFTPLVTGARTGTITIPDNAAGSPHTVALSGTGLPPLTPGVSLTPASLTFAPIAINTTSAAQTVTLTNSGTATLTLGTLAIAGDFAMASNCAGSLAPGASCLINVSFKPLVVGARTGTVTIPDNAVGSPHTIALSGTGLPPPAPLVSLVPTSLSFAARTVNTTSSAQTVTLSNTGTAGLTLGTMSITGDFQLSTNCPAVVAAGASCLINVTFTPLVPGTRTGTVTIPDNAAGNPHTIALDGTGLSATAPVVDVSPTSLTFGVEPVGSNSAPLTVTLTNSGNAPLTFGTISIVGSEFVLATIPSTATPPPCPITLAPGQSCQIGVIFHPASVNLRQANLSIATNAPTSPTLVPLSGTGLVPLPPQLSMNSGLVFGDQPVGTHSAGTPFAIKNTSQFVATITELSTTGDFSVSDTCTTIAPAATCSPLITFLPTAIGLRNGSLTVRTLRDAEPYVVTLQGTGTDNRVPALELSVTSIGFGNALLGMPVTSQVTLRNVGLATLVVSAIGASDDFFVDTGCVTNIAPGSSCTAHVTFLPAVVGRHGALLTILSNAAGSPHGVGLSGTGCYVPSPSRARFGVLLCGS